MAHHHHHEQSSHHHEHVHHHGHDHSGGGHHHHHEVKNINTAFIIGIILNTVFVVVEVIVGLSSSSLALISDAGHNATDVFSLLLSLFAFKLSKSKATNKYTYGYKRATILNSLVNAILLLFVTVGILWEGIYRFNHPVIIQGQLVSIVAFGGIFVNGISAFLFFKGKEDDINIRGAYLHLLSDAIVAFGVVLTGIVIWFTHLYWMDTLISFIIAVVILISTWRLLSESIRLALDGVPFNIDLNEVVKTITQYDEVKGVHHLHVWALSSKQNALTAHLVIEDADLTHFEVIKHKIKHSLLHLNISHATLEVEIDVCDEEICKD